MENIIFHKGSAAINQVLDCMRPDYEPILWGAGTDRFKSYDGQIQKYRKTLNLEELQAVEIERDESDISASMVRNFLLSGNQDAFNRLIPECLQKFYGDLKEEIGKVSNEKTLEQIKKTHEAFDKIDMKDEK
jgi:hypothetical protein